MNLDLVDKVDEMDADAQQAVHDLILGLVKIYHGYLDTATKDIDGAFRNWSELVKHVER